MRRSISSLLIALLMVITLVYPVMANAHACCDETDVAVVMLDVMDNDDTASHPCCMSSATLPTFVASFDTSIFEAFTIEYPPASSHFQTDFALNQLVLSIQSIAFDELRHVSDESDRHARLSVFLN